MAGLPSAPLQRHGAGPGEAPAAPQAPDPAAQLALVQEAMGIITWVWDTASDAAHWHGDLSPLLGLPPGAFRGDFTHFLACMHPDDAAAARVRLIDCLKGRRPSYRAEERVCWPDGSVHWLETYGRGLYGPDGRAVRLAGVVKDITDRRLAAAAHAASELRFRQFIEQAPVAIGMSRGDRVLYGNPRFFELFRVPDAEALEGHALTSFVTPAGRETMAERARRRGRGEPVETTYEMPALRWDGSEFTCLVALTEVQLADGPAELVFLHDVSETAQARAALRQERDRANRYLQVAESMLVAVDEQGRVTLLNRKGHQVLGYAEGELIGRDWFGTCRPPEDVEHARQNFQALMQRRVQVLEYHESLVLTRRGERRRMAWRNSPIVDEAGVLRGLLSSGEDITERRRAEQALLELNASLEHRVAVRTRELEQSNAALAVARDAAEAAMRTKGDFLAHMSHEIRTPMNAILGMTQLALRQPELAPRVRDYLGHIRHAGESLLVILNDILDFSKIESGKLEIESRGFALDEALHRVTALLAGAATDKGLTLRVHVAPEVPAQLEGDPLRLGQVLMNLCSNAIKFTERGGVELTVALQDRPAPGRVRLRFGVRDTGIGIEKAQQSRLFSPFEQIDASTTRRFGGTGLGLAICRQLVDLMGGDIGVHSEAGQGSEFHFSLTFGVPVSAEAAPRPAAVPGPPGAPVPAGATGPAVDGEVGEPAGPLRGCRILLVEDNELNRIVAVDLLTGVAQAQVAVAPDGAQALALLQRESFDLVLMDVQMPVMDGYEATRRLRRVPALAALPVIAMTAHAMARDRQLCHEAGMNDFVSKPFEPGELFAVIARWWSASARETPAARPLPGAAAAGPGAAQQAVSFELGLHRCLGRRELHQRILRRFLETRSEDAKLLRAALARGETEAPVLIAHSLVSTAGAIGAEILSARARALQAALAGGERSRWPALVEAFAQAHEEVVAALRAHLAAADAEAAPQD